MYCQKLFDYFKERTKELVEIISESYTDHNCTLIMILFSLQRIGLLFNFDQFGGKPYTDFKLIILSQLFNWFTLQTPIDIIQSRQLDEFILYLVSLFSWLSVIILFTKFQIKQVLFYYFTYYQLLILIPLIEQTNVHISIDKDYILGFISFSGLLVCYIISFLVHRNYQLPQKNIYIRRYSYFNLLLILTDIALVMIQPFFSEMVQAVTLFFSCLLFLIDSYIVQPYSAQVNIKYVCATSFTISVSIIKLFSFSIDQDKIFYFILLLSPLFIYVIRLTYARKTLNILYSSEMNQEKMLAVIDLLSDHNINPICLHSVLYDLTTKHKVTSEADNFIIRIQQIFIQIFDIIILMAKNNSKQAQENIQLYKITYITITCKRTQLGYIELKTYETSSQKQSFYFNIVSQILQNKMKTKNKPANNSNEQEKKLQLSEIRKAEILYEDSVGKVISILETKIKFWVDLDKGYQRIEDFALSAYKLSEQIWNLRDVFFQWFQIEPLKLQSRLNHFNVLELKLLAILYSAILNDYHCTLDIEQKIEEIVQVERNTQNDEVNNVTLLNDDLVMIATSFAKQKSLILNKNRAQLANFFDFNDEKEFQNIIYIEQLMPQYIQQIHDKIIIRYMKKGQSMLTEHSKEVYIKMKNNFVKAANISLLHMFENDQDYIVTGALQKVKQSSDFIIFDRKGKILAISENVFSILGTGFTLEQLLARGYIYFWFIHIFDLITDEKQQLLQTQDAFNKISLQQQVIASITGFQTLCQDHEYSRANSTVKHQESQNYLTEINDTEQFMFSIANISSTHFVKDQNFQFINDFLSKYNQSKYVDQNQQYAIKYLIQFSVLGGDILPQFVIQINEIEKINQKLAGSISYYSTFLKKSTSNNNDPFNEQDFNLENESNINNSININPPVVNKINCNPDQKIEESSQNYPNFNQTNDQLKLVSPRGNKEILINMDEYEIDLEEAQINELGKSSSQQNQNNKQDLADAIQKYKELDQEFKDNAKQSQSSATSDRTQMSVFNILRNLQYTQRYQSTLIKVFINTAILFGLLLFLVILELIIARSNTNTLQYQIPLVRLPDKFNRLYCTFVVIGQMDLEMKLLNINHGDYYKYRITAESDDIRSQLIQLVVEIEQEFSILESQGKLNQAEIAIVNQYVYFTQNISLLQFNQMVNEYTESLDKCFKETDEEDLFNEQIRLLFLKGNLKELLNFVSNLVESIVTEFFNNIDTFEFLYLIFLFIQLIIIAGAILLQFKLWVDPYQYKQNILLMICRVQDKDIELLMSKYKSFRDILQNDYSKWKKLNYFKEFFTCRISQLKTIKKQKDIHILNKKQKQQFKAKINSRILETQYSIIHIYLMLFFLWFILTAFVLSSYLYQNLNIIGSYPELDLCMQFVRFKQQFDGSMIMSQLLKNQLLLSNYQRKSGIYRYNPEYNKTNGFFTVYIEQLLNQFNISIYSGKELYQSLYDNILASSKISDNNKNLLLGLYQDDLCNFIGDQLPFCFYDNGVFQYFPQFPTPDPINNNRERLKQGFNGLYQEIQSLFSSKYVKELDLQLERDEDEIENFLSSPEYIQLLLPYFYDLNKAIVQFYQTIITSSTDILESDYQSYLIFYVIFGIVASAILFSVIILYSRKLQRQIRAIRQALVLLPHESLLDVQVYNAIKRFEQRM